VAVAYGEIERVLVGARRRRGRVALVVAAGWGLGAVLAALFLGALVLSRRPEVAAARPVAWAVAGAAALAALAWAARSIARNRSPEDVARALGAAEPSLRSDLVSSVQLEREYAGTAARGHSVEMVDEHVARTAARAAALDLARVVPDRPARRAKRALAAAALANAALLVVLGRPLALGYARLAGLAPLPKVAPRITPITGDVELTYRFPAYMDRAEQTLSGTGGEIRAPKGTEVTLRARADREVDEAQVVVEAAAGPAGPPASGERVAAKVHPLRVEGRRDLLGHFVVEGGGAYRFRFTRGEKVLAEGPPIPVVVEADAFPEIRVVAPRQELEVQPGARVGIEWTAGDDYGLGRLALILKREGAGEQRTELRDLGGARREGGQHLLDTASLRLSEGERVLYWLEVVDNDAVSGPKRAASTTHSLKVYSAAEHRRLAAERAQRLWEELVSHLAERLEFFEAGRREWDPPRLAQAQAMDGRTRALHERFAQGAAELRRDRAAPRELAQALANVAAGVAERERALSSLRDSLARLFTFQRDDSPLVRRVEDLDDRLDRELEKDVLYLEQLLDQQRAEDLVRMARELTQRRRDLAALAEKLRDDPGEETKRQLLAQIQAMRQRMEELARRMGELAKGIQDEHMNAEALAELMKSQDAAAGLDAAEKALRDGDLEEAMRRLDALGNAMEELLAAMERTAGRPGEQNRELARELRALKGELDALEQDQQRLAQRTEQEKRAYQREVGRRLEDADAKAERLQKLAAEARRQVEGARAGLTPRSEHDFEAARDRLQDLERALATRDLDAALESARKAVPPTERLAAGLREDLSLLERYPRMLPGDPQAMRDARRSAQGAVGPAREVKDELERLFPDPRSVLPKDAQARLEEQSRRQDELARRANELRERMQQLGEQAPIFPPQAGESLRDAQDQMQGAAGELSQRNPQRGHGRQQQAMDALARFRSGMEQMARRQGGQGEGGGFPYPFAMQGAEAGGGREGDGFDPSEERVEIPGADPQRGSEEFRRDLLEAMKQGTPERYRGEVSRYYQEIVK
jgi:chromosome segregation ATPase